MAAPNPVDRLVGAALRAPSADNSQPWRFEWDGERLSMWHRSTGEDLFGASDHATLLSVGCAMEAISEYLRVAGAEAGIAWSNKLADGAPYATIALPPPSPAWPEMVPGMSRHTNRFPYSARPVDDAWLRNATSMHVGTARVIAISDASAIHALARAVKVCSEARFRTRELHEGLVRSLRTSGAAAASGTGLDVATLNLPVGGEAFLRLTSDWRVMRALNGLGVYRVLAAAETALFRKAPAVLAIVGRDSDADVVDAGRLLQRVWVDANLAGLAVHPYYVVADQAVRLRTALVPPELRPAVERALAALPSQLGLRSGETLGMLLRLGWPMRDAPRSRRLPVSALLRDVAQEP